MRVRLIAIYTQGRLSAEKEEAKNTRRVGLCTAASMHAAAQVRRPTPTRAGARMPREKVTARRLNQTAGPSRFITCSTLPNHRPCRVTPRVTFERGLRPPLRTPGKTDTRVRERHQRKQAPPNKCVSSTNEWEQTAVRSNPYPSSVKQS